jgi:hypothetical protein
VLKRLFYFSLAEKKKISININETIELKGLGSNDARWFKIYGKN